MPSTLPTALAVIDIKTTGLHPLRDGIWEIGLLLVDAQGGLVGYFVAMIVLDEVHLLNITVAPARQRQGWARILLDALALWSRQRQAQWIWLEVRESNVRARSIYAAHGYQEVGLRKNYYPMHDGPREHAVLMSLKLWP